MTPTTLTIAAHLALLALLSSAAPAAGLECAPPRTSLLVAPFGDRTDGVWALWTGHGVGEGFAEMFADTLTRSGHYRVQADSASREGGGNSEDRLLRAARAMGCEVLVTGTVSRFGYEDRTGPGRMLRWGMREPGMRTVATVSAGIRVLDVRTGTVLFETSVSRERVQGGSSMAGQRCFEDRASFDDALVGRAARDVMGALAGALQRQLALRWSAHVVRAPGVSGVLLDAGAGRGVEPGTRLVVWRPGIQVFDPETGPVGPREVRVGELLVTGYADAGRRRAVARVLAGMATPGDVVRPCSGADGNTAAGSTTLGR